jgi:hypothetical protein
MVRALRGDSSYPSLSDLRFVRAMRAVRDDIHPALRRALDAGDKAHPDIVERWRGPVGENFGPIVVDVDPVGTAHFMYRSVSVEERGDHAIERILRDCGIDPRSPSGIATACELALAPPGRLAALNSASGDQAPPAVGL